MRAYKKTNVNTETEGLVIGAESSDERTAGKRRDIKETYLLYEKQSP